MIDIKSGKIESWSEALARVINKDYSADAIADLLRSVESLLAGKSGMITLYSKSNRPKTTHHRLLADEDPDFHIHTYENGAYLLDPFYRKAMEDRLEGAFTLKDVAPEGFEHSEYYSVFYKNCGFENELCLIFQLEQDYFVSLSVVKHNKGELFAAPDIALIRCIFPILKSVINRFVINYVNAIDTSFENHLDNALEAFGTSLLTPKECEILHFVLRGYANKCIAGKMDNSAETIKHHRKNIYLKLDVSSQSELFYLFIAALKALPEGSKQDPLIYI
ncbi:helix-turn-helix domain-containing protein [Thalassotalea mangrovi]|uniref:Helix-turn-helix transcriptional regulator n=1 Tax=Thalassotalea mangrovi TaxID=2572245 RepID=A0A4U1B506_9GAMM|nr:helix-turn-helix transcriptional regulator [Thalassotalea mangrovi]TKB45377.1 helix-turn-helix transcriptional regulator [Thalassotalea mangrovi]